MIVYQVLARLFGSGRFSAFDSRSLGFLKDLGITHIWYTGVLRHSSGKDYVKGNIGSPYSITDYYDVNPYLANNEEDRMAEFERLINRTHKAGMKVILDLIPNHVSPDYSDSHGGIPTLGRHDYDWTDTDKIDYSDRRSWDALENIVSYWCSKGVDGFRCDMVELVPVRFFSEMITRTRKDYPGTVFIGECYDFANYATYLNQGHFDYLYDKSGMYDTLRGVVAGDRPASDITANWQKLGPLQGRMLNFLENHDEQRIASPWFAGSAKRGYCALAVSALFFPAPFMLYFGQEIGEAALDGHEGRTSIFDEAAHIRPFGKLGAYQHEVLQRYREVLHLAGELEGSANFDLCYCQKQRDGFDSCKHFAFLRYNDSIQVLIACNFSSSEAEMKLRIPSEATQVFGNELVVNIPAWDFIVLRK